MSIDLDKECKTLVWLKLMRKSVWFLQDEHQSHARLIVPMKTLSCSLLYVSCLISLSTGV